MTKSELRKLHKKQRDEIAVDIRTSREKRIIQQLFSLEEVINAKTIFIYNSFGSEVSTKELTQKFLQEGKEIYVPKIFGEIMKAVKFDGEQEINKYGILEPKENVFAKSVDLTITPLLAVDKFGNRIGYGKGYYDKFFMEHKTLKIGICFSNQIVDKIDSDENDIPLDYVIYDGGVIKTERI